MIRFLRRVLKPALLHLNAWRYKQSEKHLADLYAMRAGAVWQVRQERRRQAKLKARRNELAGW